MQSTPGYWYVGIVVDKKPLLALNANHIRTRTYDIRQITAFLYLARTALERIDQGMPYLLRSYHMQHMIVHQKGATFHTKRTWLEVQEKSPHA